MTRERVDPFAQWGTFVPFFLALLEVPTVTRTDVALFGALVRFDKLGECRPAVATLADELALDVADVRRRLRKLEQLGLIRRHQRAGQPSLIELLMYTGGPNHPRSERPRLKSPRAHSTQGASAQAPQAVSAEVPQAVSAYQQEEQEKTTRREGTRSARPEVSGSHIQEFDEVLRAEAFARGQTPPALPPGQRRAAAQRARDHATQSRKPFAEAARDLVVAGLEQAGSSGRPLGLVLGEVEPGARVSRKRWGAAPPSAEFEAPTDIGKLFAIDEAAQ